jgi:cytochrome c
MKMKVAILPLAIFIISCNNNNEAKKITSIDPEEKRLNYIKPIPGKSDSIPTEISQKGKVLIAYSDCYTCHAVDKRVVGPAFKDIAERYPVQEQYVALLAQRIIIGGSGVWGYPVMISHPNLKEEEAKMMVKFILSLKE